MIKKSKSYNESNVRYEYHRDSDNKGCVYGKKTILETLVVKYQWRLLLGINPSS